MRLSHVLLTLTLAFLPVTATLAFQESDFNGGELSGQAHVLDGNTLVIGQQRVNLFGLDAPDVGQSCDVGAHAWRCGQAARDLLARAIGRGDVTCQVRFQDEQGRIAAVCQNEAGEDLNSWMVHEGLAVAVQDAPLYMAQERNAQSVGNGVWGGPFIRPDVYRQRQLQNFDGGDQADYSANARTGSYGQSNTQRFNNSDEQEPKPTFRGMACVVLHKGC